MNLRKLAFGIMTLSFILIISGGVSSFVLGLKKDREATFKRQMDVNNTFEEFSTNTSVFESVREELFTKTLSNLYLETMYNEDKAVKEKLSNYENIVDEMYRSSQELETLCNNMIFPDNTANSRCQNYKSIYEQVNNYFVSDIVLYNQTVKKFNEFQESLGTNVRVRNYETKKEYIDYNKDGRFDGKEE